MEWQGVHIDLNYIITTILTYMYKTVQMLQRITFEYGGYVFSAFDATIALFCVAQVIVIIFGDFIDPDDFDDLGAEHPID